MKIDELIKKLNELKKEYGNREVKLFTQRDAWSWEEYGIETVYYTEECLDGACAIYIEGKDMHTPGT